uniref:DUF2612 domain-containing protein n=1 Tax=Anaerococcus mediterraneensis TaxID=1870984 RepID=UPI000930F265|nr:DUF2612 domain-containing protein [Anaerococcus mediterraneensis]
MYKYEEAFERLPERFRKPNNKKLYYVLYGYGFDEMEKALEGIEDSRDLKKASGKSLDLLGANVGQLRQGEDDERYRLLIQTKIIANLSMGDIPTINHVLNTLIDDKYIGLVEGFRGMREPASFLIDFDGFTNQDLDFLISRVKAAGVAYRTRRTYKQNVFYASTSLAGETVVISEPAPKSPVTVYPAYFGASNVSTYEEVKILDGGFYE